MGGAPGTKDNAKRVRRSQCLPAASPPRALSKRHCQGRRLARRTSAGRQACVSRRACVWQGALWTPSSIPKTAQEAAAAAAAAAAAVGGGGSFSPAAKKGPSQRTGQKREIDSFLEGAFVPACVMSCFGHRTRRRGARVKGQQQ